MCNYHFGGFKGQRTDTSTLKEIDYGGMLLTTQNIYFGGERTTFRIPYDHVVSFRPHSDEIGISSFKSLIWKKLARSPLPRPFGLSACEMRGLSDFEHE